MDNRSGWVCLAMVCLAAVWGEVDAAFAAQSELSGMSSYECGDACLLPGAPVPAGRYAVVSPVGKQTVQMIKQAPRLDTLDGKNIAVVGGSFMANITHPEIKRLILAHHPTAKVILAAKSVPPVLILGLGSDARRKTIPAQAERNGCRR